MYGILIAFSVSITVESSFEFIKNPRLVYFVLLIVGSLMTYIFFRQFKRINSIQDLTEYNVYFNKKKDFKNKDLYKLFSENLKDNFKQKKVGKFTLTPPPLLFKEIIKRLTKSEGRVSIWKNWTVAGKISRIYFYEKETYPQMVLLIEEGVFGDKLDEAIRDTMNYLHKKMDLITKPKIKFSGYYYLHYLAPIILKGKQVD